MTNPITPPPELVQQWWEEVARRQYGSVEADEHIAEQAAQWGADQELEACCKLLELSDPNAREFLCAARRPKPPSLKEQALKALPKRLNNGFMSTIDDKELALIRRALEALDD